MTFWQWLDRVGDRRLDRRKFYAQLRAERNRDRARLLPTDFGGWLGLALFIQSMFLFGLMWAARDLLNSQGFMTLASAVIVTGWVGGAVAFAFKMGKGAAETEVEAKRAEVDGKRADATTSMAELAKAALSTPGTQAGAAEAAEQVADAAANEAEKIKGSD